MVTLADIKSKVVEVWKSDHIVLPSVTAAQFILESAFRKYATWQDSVQDHSDFFTSTETRKKVYSGIIGQTDYIKACNAMTGSYATDSSYGKKLIAIIEANSLDGWDETEEEIKVVKVYISPSSQQDNIGVGNFGTEEARMNQIADVVESELKRVGIITLRNNPSMDITQMVAASNNFGADIHLAIHSNAGGATGAEAYYYTGSAASKKLAQAIYDQIAPMTPTADRGIKATTELYEVWATNAVATLVEIAFHDNAGDANFILNNIQELGIAIAKGLCSYLGIDFGTAAASPAVPTGPVRIPVAYDATITSGGYSIDSHPWGEDGRANWGTTDAQLNKAFYFYEENESGEYANGTGLGWVDKRALTKGIIAPVVASQQPETVSPGTVLESILYLPNGNSWTIYPEDSDYKTGHVISTQAAPDSGLYLKVLGDKGNNILIVDLPDIGQTAIYFDTDKKATITQKLA